MKECLLWEFTMIINKHVVTKLLKKKLKEKHELNNVELKNYITTLKSPKRMSCMI